MKLERVLRKAAPFLLIAIFIACLFSITQKEGLKMQKRRARACARRKKNADNVSTLTRHAFTTPKSYTDR